MRKVSFSAALAASRAGLVWKQTGMRSSRGAVAVAAAVLTGRRHHSHLPTTTETSVPATTAAASIDSSDLLNSAFLQSLLDPPDTVPLVDATRTYRTMDVVEDAYVYDPRKPNVTTAQEALAAELADIHKAPATAVSAEAGESQSPHAQQRYPTPLRDAHAAGTLWRCFVSITADEKAANRPPAWFETLCRDLFFRTDSTVPNEAGATTSTSTSSSLSSSALSEQADGALIPPAGFSPDTIASSASSSATPTAAAAGTDARAEIDPYLWLPFDLLDEKDYGVHPYVFPSTATYTLAQRLKLCLGQPQKEYVHFCNTYNFPERHQIPTSLGTRPARLHVDPSNPAEVVFVQLSDDFPPAMWLPVKGTAAAVRRVLSEYAQMAVVHRDRHHEAFLTRYEDACRVMALQQLPTSGDDGGEGDVLRFMAYEARNTPYWEAPLREYRNQQGLFLGEHDDPEWMLEHLDLCPYVFSMAHMRTVTNPHKEHMIPTIQGPGVASSLFRCVFSKALLMVNVQLSAEVKLPPQDPEGFEFLWKDSQVMPKMKIPVFVRVMWPDNTRMSANGLLTQRLNRLFNLELAPDMPPDAALALLYVSQWAQRVPDLLGVRGMRQRVAELEAACQTPDPPRLYPGTREIPNPEYTNAERLGMHIQYLSELGDTETAETIRQMLPRASAPVRMGCAKAALIAGERELFRQIVSSEPPGRMQLYMTKLVRKRKSRDLVDPEPRLLDEQYEFAAPLWTKKGTRIDRNTLEGAVDAARLRSR